MKEKAFIRSGGALVMPQVLSHCVTYPAHIIGVVLSHQDPDIVAGSAWVDLIKAPIYISKI